MAGTKGNYICASPGQFLFSSFLFFSSIMIHCEMCLVSEVSLSAGTHDADGVF